MQQAEWTAREALEIDADNAQAQLILGWTLAREYRYTAEALDYLRRAARTYPVAHLAAADVLTHQGSLTEARAELKAYRDSGDEGIPARRRELAEAPQLVDCCAWLSLVGGANFGCNPPSSRLFDD